VTAVGTAPGPDALDAATGDWVRRHLAPGEQVVSATALSGGWTSRMRRLTVRGGPDGERSLVLRSFTTEFFRRHAPGLLNREAQVLRLLAGTGVPAASVLAVDPVGEECAAPSLLMSLLPGELRLTDDGARERSTALARQLTAIHALTVPAEARPRRYQAWAAPDRVRLPEHPARPEVWRRAVRIIDREPPAFRGCFLHRDYHPGNVLFSGGAQAPEITGVVDWVETSWGPADLDVAHCSTSLALLHGAAAGLRFAEDYAAGGSPGARPSAATGGPWTRSASRRMPRRSSPSGGSAAART
jgi:aminoglycoside phosphotransferase (APT) family kinase protein